MSIIYSDDYIEIITRLRVARKSQNMSQKQLAEILNVTQSTISKIENCERKIDIIDFLNWALALNLSFEELIPYSLQKTKKRC